MGTARNEMQLAGKKALVFGGTSGIGMATCQQLMTSGAQVVAFSRNPSKEGLPDGLITQSCDVLDREQLAQVFAEHAPFDILVNAATGGSRAVGPFLSMDLDGFKGSFVLVSGAPSRKSKSGQIALSCVGGSVENFVRALAPELAPRRINVVSPGLIATPMFGAESEERAEKLAAASANHTIPRPGRPEEVAKGIMFVIQNEFVTGTTVDVDGGWLCA